MKNEVFYGAQGQTTLTKLQNSPARNRPAIVWSFGGAGFRVWVAAAIVLKGGSSAWYSSICTYSFGVQGPEKLGARWVG